MPAKKSATSKKLSERGFVITRIFDAPRPLVFAAWTQPRHLKRWSAPHGFTVPVSKGTLQPGGKWRACMESAKTRKLWLSGVYREIVKDELLVFTHAWENEDGSRENETLVTVRFSDVGGKTKVMMKQSGFDSATSSAGHKGGWNECLDKLAELLSRLSAK
jgi:uncharacterized protein YndB with AHSA1/START domain